ncbi:hypothetical protein AC249_AIPGENE16195 [Exaiptasia diaphana]|nr:hypothetical protein AC249_AIPGENE16195 [Exaiptasia diaphana]
MGLQFYGECWSRKDAKNRYAKYGTSKKCVNLKYKECQNGMDCVGKEETNFVYKVQKDLPSPTLKPTTPGVRSPKPSGSGTSTAKKPPSPTKVPTPCSQPQPCQPVVYVSSVVPGPYAQSSSNGAMVHLPSCGPKCSPQCVPSCNVGCCLSHYRGKPMQRQNRCRRGCPTKCAPKCLPGCCRLFGGLHKDSAISKHTGPSLDDE